MARTLPSTVVAAMFAQTTGKMFPVLMEVTHSALPTTRLVNDTQPLTSNGDVYSPYPFSLILPPDTEDFAPVLKVKMANVDRLIVQTARTIAGSRERAQATVMIVDHDAPDVILAQWSNFDVANLTYNAEELEFDLIVESFLAEGFPGDSFSPATTPGIF